MPVLVACGCGTGDWRWAADVTGMMGVLIELRVCFIELEGGEGRKEDVSYGSSDLRNHGEEVRLRKQRYITESTVDASCYIHYITVAFLMHVRSWPPY